MMTLYLTRVVIVIALPIKLMLQFEEILENSPKRSNNENGEREKNLAE